MSEPVIISWDKKQYYDLVDFSKELISKRSCRDVESLKEELTISRNFMVPITNTILDNYWERFLEGNVLGTNLTTKEYIATNYPEFLL